MRNVNAFVTHFYRTQNVMKSFSFFALVLTIFLRESEGAANLHGCDSSGFCPCTSSNASECHECFECYKDVRTGLQAQMVRFYDLKARVDSFEAGLSNKTVAYRLSDLAMKLDWLDMDIDEANRLNKNLTDRLKAVESTLDEVERKLNEVDELLRWANQSAEHAATKADEIASLIAETKMKLQEAHDKLMKAYDRLKEAQTDRDTIRSLAMNMSALATEAEGEAMRQYNKAKEINDTATMAYETAMNAKQKAEAALNRQQDDKTRLEYLMMKVEEREGKLDDVKMAVEGAEMAAQKAYMDAMALYNRAMLPRPDHGLLGAIERLGKAQTDTKDLAAMLTDLHSRFADVVMRISTARTTADDKKDEVEMAVEAAKNLKNRSAEALKEAEKALEDANKVISDATNMLNILVNFTRIINESQAKATEALKNISMIEEMVNDTIKEARQILDEHEQALMDAKMAVNVSCEAVFVAEKALEEINKCKEEFEGFKTTVMDLVDDATAEKANATKLNATAEERKSECPGILQRAGEKDEAVNEAVGDQRYCTERVDKARGRVMDIQKRIDNLPRLDSEEVAQLRSDLDGFKVRLDAADIPGMIGMIEQQRDALNVELAENDDMIGDMKKDLANLELIIGAGSQGCVFVGP